MNTRESARLEILGVYEELSAVVGERTLDIVETRRKTARVRRRGWLVRRALATADVIGLSLAFLVAHLAFDEPAHPYDRIQPNVELALFLATLPVWVVIAKLYGLYDRDELHTSHTTVDDVVRVVHLVTVGAWLLWAFTWLTRVASLAPPKLLTFWALAVVLVPLLRAAARCFSRRRIAYIQNTVIVGAGDVGQLIARKILQHPEYGINLVGFVDSAPKDRRPDLDHLTVLGGPDRLPAIVRLLDVERVVIAFSNDSHLETLELIRSLKDLQVQVDVVPRLFELAGAAAGTHAVEGIPLVAFPSLHLSRSWLFLKRAMDLVGSATALVVLAPLFALIAWGIKRDSAGPAFFSQVRMGKGGKPFRMYKFRTMVVDAEARKPQVVHLNKHAADGGDPRMFKVPGDPRVTRFGRLLRRYSLDELPQLFNVLKGEMSLVGPRPLILDEDEHVGEWARKRLDLKPGMTGLWQVLGRSDIPFDEMVKLDYVYVTNWSLWNDCRLLWRTIPVVLRGQQAAY
jgi:exopolysaccharide biosynthesis polyprenyl glycosylphosphotransferase